MDTPRSPWERSSASRRARKSETQGAKLQGGQRQPGSGAFRGRPGDIRDEDWLIEDKFTDADSFIIKRSMLDKTIREALSDHGRLAQWRITMPGYKLRLIREEDYLYLKAKADGAAD